MLRNPWNRGAQRARAPAHCTTSTGSVGRCAVVGRTPGTGASTGHCAPGREEAAHHIAQPHKTKVRPRPSPAAQSQSWTRWVKAPGPIENRFALGRASQKGRGETRTGLRTGSNVTNSQPQTPKTGTQTGTPCWVGSWHQPARTASTDRRSSGPQSSPAGESSLGVGGSAPWRRARRAAQWRSRSLIWDS